MFKTEKTVEFDKWIRKLKDFHAKARILLGIQKLETDEYFGDCKYFGDGIRELRIDYAKGYRVYFKAIQNKIIALLIGGEKSSQRRDIKKAKDICNKLKNN